MSLCKHYSILGQAPSSPIVIIHIVAATIISLLLYIASIILLKGD